MTAAVAARSNYLARHPSVSLESLVIYATTQTHSFAKKAGLILGLKVRALEVDENARQGHGLDAATLRAAIEDDQAAGRAPFILSARDLNCHLFMLELNPDIVATVGTTTSGAIDHIEDVGKLRAYLDLHSQRLAEYTKQSKRSIRIYGFMSIAHGSVWPLRARNTASDSN